MQYLKLEIFLAIINPLGKFIEAYMSFKTMGKMLVARILVILDIKKGLAQEL